MRQKASYNYNKYGDNLARKRRRRFFVKIAAILLSIITLASAAVYLIFFSPYLKITETEISGLETIERQEIESIVNYFKNHKIFGRIGLTPYANILFFDTSLLENKIPADFPEIKSIEADKDFPNKINIRVVERSPSGTWCDASKCRYFDESGVMWGDAIRSRGSLLMNIDDKRINEKGPTVDMTLLEAVNKSVIEFNNIGIRISKVEIPIDYIGDFIINTSRDFYIKLSINSDIAKQVESLKILLDNKGGDFNPEYIDLRINDKLYYK